ncbi:MAG: peptide chain release factor 3, partial [Gammaproteobacteria bacterium]
KLDRDGREPLDLLDEIEEVLAIQCAPVTWPVGMGRDFRGVFHIYEDRYYLYQDKDGSELSAVDVVDGLDSAEAREQLGEVVDELAEAVELIRGASADFDVDEYLAGRQTPVFFGAAIHNFGVEQLLDAFVEHAPGPQPRETTTRTVLPDEDQLTGFVFKIQANMDPAHRDRIAFMRVCSGCYEQGMKLYQPRLGREVRVGQAITFMASERQQAVTARAGDIIGLHNHGTINIGDSFSEGEDLAFTGIPNFAPELFRRAVLRDPLKLKALQKGLAQLCEEGATQLFRPLSRNDLIIGAVGQLQFDVASFRLKSEYGVECSFEAVDIATARWVKSGDAKRLEEFKSRLNANLAVDHAGELVLLAPSNVSLRLTEERWPDIELRATREHSLT